MCLWVLGAGKLPIQIKLLCQKRLHNIRYLVDNIIKLVMLFSWCFRVEDSRATSKE